MKKFFLVLIAAIGTMMASCSKDDNEIIEPEPTPKLADVSNAWSSDHEGTCEEFYKKKW